MNEQHDNGHPRPRDPESTGAGSGIDRDAAFRRPDGSGQPRPAQNSPAQGGAPMPPAQPREDRRPERASRPDPNAISQHTRRIQDLTPQTTREIELAAAEMERQQAQHQPPYGGRPAPPPLANRPAHARKQEAEQEQIIDEYGLSDDDKKSKKRAERELRRIKRLLRRRVRGKPRVPASERSFWSGLGQGIYGLFKTFLVLLLVLIIFVGSVGVGVVFAYVSSTEPIPASLLVSGDETSFVYSADGEVLSKLTGAYNIDREYVSLASVSNTYIADAFISIEDERFESHIGIDPRRIASAVLSVFTTRGTGGHGGSTIVQQTVKLLTGEDQRTAQRKFQEWYRAIILNQQLSKAEIMELYINLVPMANQYVGIQTAAKAYFSKDASELDLAECAYLAGIPKSPYTYNPYREAGLRNGLRRQRIVLRKMHQLGRITTEEYQDALNQELKFNLSPPKISGTDIQDYFTEYAIREAIQLLKDAGYRPEVARWMVTSGGLRIYTTLDPAIQAVLDETYADSNNFQRDPSIYVNWPETPQSSAVIIDNATGAVVGMAGGIGKKTANLITNRATDIRRQPGSSLKPLAAYAPAMDMGLITGATVFEDKEVYLDPSRPNTPWPLNFTRTYVGDIIMRYALKMSLNVPAVETMSLLGVENAKYYLDRNGIDMTDDTSQLALALGAMTYGVSPIALTAAYATFFNQGVYREPYVVRRIENSDGETILDNEPEQHRVFQPETAYMTARILEEVALGQTSSAYSWGVAANYGKITNANGEIIQTSVKSGTTENFVDQWFAGGTPYYTLAVWYGFDNEIKVTSIPPTDEYTVIDVWYHIMRQLHQDKASADWIQPPGIQAVTICAQTGYLANQYDINNGYAITEYFPIGSPLIPDEYCPMSGAVKAPEGEEGEGGDGGGDQGGEQGGGDQGDQGGGDYGGE